MFEREAEALNVLKNQSNFLVPEPIRCGVIEQNSYLLMEYIPHNRGPYPNADAGRKLAQLHQNSSPSFGLETSNYIGSLSQENSRHSNWIPFFIEQRIRPLLKQTEAMFSDNELKQCDRLFTRLEQFFPTEKPSLLHGDLWSGNTFTSETNEPVLIDPAMYYGHRLMDLGMTRLFGGFSAEFYAAYQEVQPLESNWEDACEIANLYPLLVHLRLFGMAYKGQIIDLLSTYS